MRLTATATLLIHSSAFNGRGTHSLDTGVLGGGGSGPTGDREAERKGKPRYLLFLPPFVSVCLFVAQSVSLMLLLGSLQEGCWRLMWLTLA